MAINSSSNPRFGKPGFLKSHNEKVNSRIDKFLNSCELLDTLVTPLQKLLYAKFLMDKRRAILPEEYLKQTFGRAQSEKITGALNHELNKFKTDENKKEFLELLENRLIKDALGEHECFCFYNELFRKLKLSPGDHITAIDEEIRKLQTPVVQSRGLPATAQVPATGGLAPLPSTPPAVSVQPAAPTTTAVPPSSATIAAQATDSDSWDEHNAASAGSSVPGNHVIYAQIPQMPHKAKFDNEKS